MSLPVTRSLVEDAAAGLAGDGWHFTQRQLYYATCARAETPRSNAAANGEIGVGALLVLVGLILIGIKVAFVLLLSLGVALVLAGILGRLRRPMPAARLLALSFDEFRGRFGDVALPGLIDPGAGSDAPRADANTTVICDTQDTAAMVAANLARAQLAGTSVVSAAHTGSPPTARVVAIHDASPRGCALLLDLRDAGIAAEDAGLRPGDVDDALHQVLEGAPARMPRDLAPLLGSEEIDWLLSGRRVEVATLSPELAMSRVVAAISRLEPLHGDAPRPAR